MEKATGTAVKKSGRGDHRLAGGPRNSGRQFAKTEFENFYGGSRKKGAGMQAAFSAPGMNPRSPGLPLYPFIRFHS